MLVRFASQNRATGKAIATGKQVCSESCDNFVRKRSPLLRSVGGKNSQASKTGACEMSETKMNVIRLRIRKHAERGFYVTLIALGERNLEAEGFLPPFPDELPQLFQQWEQGYRAIEEIRTAHRITPIAIENYSGLEITTKLERIFNSWLNDSDDRWRTIRDHLLSLAQRSNRETHVILDAHDSFLRRLPWQEWEVFEKCYPDSEVFLRLKNSFDRDLTGLRPQSDRPRVLVVIGENTGIDTSRDEEIIGKLKECRAEVILLRQPTRQELSEALWDERGYNIFVFAGHSRSQANGEIGWLHLNPSENVSIEEFKKALKAAVNNGLQLAIFNSCDGLGLATQAINLNLPRCLVMREPVPDRVAVTFIEYFFENFTSGMSLYRSVQKARQRLEPFEIDYPGVDWLPTLCTRLSAPPLLWQDFFTDEAEQGFKPEQTGARSGVASPPETEPVPAAKPDRRWNYVAIAAIAGSFIFSALVLAIAFWPKESLGPVATEMAEELKDIDPKAGNWRYGGSTSWATIRAEVDTEIARAHPDFNLINSPQDNQGSTLGIDKVIRGVFAFSQSSRPLRPEEIARAEAQPGIKLRQIPVAIDGIAIAIRPDLDIEGLSYQQLQKIYTGKITNWQELGGPDLDIVPYSRSDDGGTTGFFQDEILGSDPIDFNVVKEVADTTEALRKIASETPGGIYYGTASQIVEQCQIKAIAISLQASDPEFVSLYRGDYIPPDECQNGDRNQLDIEVLRSRTYPLTRNFWVIFTERASDEKTAGRDYARLLLTDRGQELIEKANLVPYRGYR